MDTATLNSKNLYEELKASVKLHYQRRQLPGLYLDCRLFKNGNKQPSLTVDGNKLYDAAKQVKEISWFLYFLDHREHIFPDYQRLKRKALTSCHEAVSNLAPRSLTYTDGEHWFKVTSEGKVLKETESCSFWFSKDTDSLHEDEGLKQGLLDLRCINLYVLNVFLENYTMWEKEDELPEIYAGCGMYVLHSEPPRFGLSCYDTSTMEWFLFFLINHLRLYPEYEKLVSDAKYPCNEFASAVLHDLKAQTGCSKIDNPPKKRKIGQVKYPKDCELLVVERKGGNFDARTKTSSPKFDRPIQWPIALQKEEFEPIRDTMKSIVSYARRTFMEQTENTRSRLREETPISENVEADGPSALQITEKNCADASHALCGDAPWCRH